MISADRHIVRVWDAATGANFTTIQPPEPGINDVLTWRGSGLLMLGMDQPNIEARTRRPSLACPALSSGTRVHKEAVDTGNVPYCNTTEQILEESS